MKGSRAAEWRSGVIATVVLLTIYCATLAPSVTLWDSGEFLAAVHSLGIPHPPGTPLFIMLAHVWSRVLSPVLGFAVSVNLFSAVCTAASCGIMARIFARWTGNATAALFGAIAAGAMSSVWHNANETEVYSAALLMACLLMAIGEAARVTREHRWLVLLAYVAALAWTLHLSALIALPAAVTLAFSSGADEGYEGNSPHRTSWNFSRRELTGLVPALLAVAVLGASAALFLIVRAAHDPAINQGNPETWSALREVLSRQQYQPAGLLPRQAPWFIQVGNLFEYADWQVALGLAPGAPPSWWRTPLTLAYGCLGVAGAAWHRNESRATWRAMVVLFLTSTLGVIVYLNMKASPSFGAGFLPPGAKHEARERDYFFLLGFVCWGMWAGLGAVRIGSLLKKRSALGTSIAGLLAAAVPVAFNWTAVDRSREPRASEARSAVIGTLTEAPPRAVILASGDNDTYPVWFLQQVEGTRRDVTVVTIPLLGGAWYRAELARRHGLGAAADSRRWMGAHTTLERICADAKTAGRPVVLPARSGIAMPGACH